MRPPSFELVDLRFPSGLRVLIDVDHRAPVVGVFAVVGSGSAADPVGKEGLAHFVEHLTFRSRPDGKSSLWSLLQSAGAGSWSARTDLDTTLFYEVGPKETLPGLLLLESARLLAPLTQVTPEALAAERVLVADELVEGDESGFLPAFGPLAAAIFPAGHPYARLLNGTPTTLAGFTIEDARRFAAENYRAANTTMVIVGDVDPVAVRATIEQSLPTELRAASTTPTTFARVDPKALEPMSAPPTPIRRITGVGDGPRLWIGWSLPSDLGDRGILAKMTSRMVVSRFEGWNAKFYLVSGARSSLLICGVAVDDAEHAETVAAEVYKNLEELFRVGSSLRGTRGLVEAVNGIYGAVTSTVLDAESLVDRGVKRALFTHFSADPGLYSRNLHEVMKLEPARIGDFGSKYINAERAHAVMITPLAKHEDRGERLGPGSTPIDEAPPAAFDAETLRRYVRPLGLGAYRRLTLPNGLEAVIGRREGLPVVTVGLSLHGGDASAAPAGAPRVVREVAMASGRKQGHPAEFGGTLARTAGADDYQYVLQGGSGNIAEMVAVLAEDVASMEVHDANVRAYFDGWLPDAEKVEQWPEIRADQAFKAALYGDSPLGRTVAARARATLDAPALQRWIDRNHVPGNATLAIVGDIDPEAVASMIVGRFGAWSAVGSVVPPPASPALPPAPATRPAFVAVHQPDTRWARIRFGCLLAPVGEGTTATATLAAVLAESALERPLRRDLDARYHVVGAVGARRAATTLELTTEVETRHLAGAIARLRSTLTGFAAGRVDAADLDRARWQVGSRYVFNHGANRALVSAILDARNRGASVASIDGYPEEVIRPSPADLGAAFARCLAGRPVISIVGDEPAVRAAIAESWP
jgi:zinc protease